MGMAGQIIDESIINNCLGFLKPSSQVMYGIHYKIIGKCIKQHNKGNDNQVDEVGGHDEEYDESDK